MDPSPKVGDPAPPPQTPTVALVGTLDTKGREYAFVRERLGEAGVHVILVDTGVYAPQGVQPDIARHEVARAGGADVDELARRGDRGAAVTAMGQGAGQILRQLHARGDVQAALALGGSGAAAMAALAMRELPVGVPKLVVSTVTASDLGRYIDARDFTFMYPVLDISGINRLSARILTNAAAAVAGMARATVPSLAQRPLLAATMFGVTTPAVTAARAWLEHRGYDVLVFHANGAGGRSMESMIREGMFAGVLDLTTTELADAVAGGTLSAGPDRLQAAGKAGIPQVVSLGALDMANFGPLSEVPEPYRQRRLHAHNAQVTLMRTTPEECSRIGRLLAEKLNAARGPTVLFVPLRGVSMIAEQGQVFHDAQADAALFQALRDHLQPHVERVELDLPINDPAFAEAMAERLDALCRQQGVLA